MKIEIFIILACVPLYVINSFCDKYISAKNGNKYNFLYNCIKFLVGSVVLLPAFISDDLPKYKFGTVLCGVACGVMYAISKTVILKGYEKSSVAFMTLCHSSGMILPCLIGHFFWSESLSIWSLVGILLAIVAIVLLKDSKHVIKKFDLMGIVIGGIIFLTSGAVMILQKFMGIYFVGQSIAAYNFYSFVTAFLILSALIRSQTDTRKNGYAIVLCAIVSAVSLCMISMVMTGLAGKVPSVILFPLFNGFGIIFVCIGSAFVFKEKFTKRKSVGLILGILGLCLVNF